jgi:Zn-dependent protease
MPMLISLNIGFAVFNLLPLPPLDGFHLVTSSFANKNFRIVEFLQRYGYIILIVLLLSGVLTNVLGMVSGGLLTLYGKFFSLFV